ncbi:MAG: YMGG-like glycine zipper-containing protein [Chthoniobacteraceae bacterium]
MKRIIPLTLSIVSLTLAGCETTGETTLLGAGVGAGIAALTGHSPLRGAAIGAGSGFLVGKVVKHERQRSYEQGYDDGRSGYPHGRYSNQRGFVVSPYSPNHVIDVRGIPRGARVLDPSCDRVFINP